MRQSDQGFTRSADKQNVTSVFSEARVERQIAPHTRTSACIGHKTQTNPEFLSLNAPGVFLALTGPLRPALAHRNTLLIDRFTAWML